jgi:hypothetical protein
VEAARVIALALLLLAAPVEDAAPFQQGVAAYQAVDLDTAAAKFTEALPLAESDADRAKVHAWLGLIAAQLQKTSDAKRSFATAVSLDAAVAMPAEAPPAVTKLLEDARHAAPVPPPRPPRSDDATAADGDTAPAESTHADTVQGDAVPLAPLLAGGAGGVLAIAGGVLVAVAADTALRQAPAAEFNDDANALADRSATEYAVGGVLLGLGAVAIAAAVALVAME